MNLAQIVLKPLITEKATGQGAENKYCFKVEPKANREQVKQAIEQIFGVKVVRANLITVRGKSRRVGRSQKVFKRANWKKAIVQLKEGEKLEAFNSPVVEGKKDKNG